MAQRTRLTILSPGASPLAFPEPLRKRSPVGQDFPARPASAALINFSDSKGALNQDQPYFGKVF
jgi:hypothetical protein